MALDHEIKVGSVRIVDMTFNVDDTPTDPSTLTVYVYKQSTGAQLSYVYGTDPEVERVSPGVYLIQLILDVEGTWIVGVLSTGVAADYKEVEFYVWPQAATLGV